MNAPTTPAPFVMHSARSAIAAGLLHIEEQVKAIEQAVVENPGLAFDLAKTLIESACKSILSDRGQPFDKSDNLPRLFRLTREILPLVPSTLEEDLAAKQSLDQTLNGLHTAIQGICALRNAFGFASHGSEGPRPSMEAIHATLVAQAADAIVGFLYGVHRQEQGRPGAARLEYDDHPDFNEWIDEQSAPVRILDLPPYRPSEVLFNVDPEAYRALLADFATDEANGTAPGQAGEAQ